jgi:hypothetical protein
MGTMINHRRLKSIVWFKINIVIWFCFFEKSIQNYCIIGLNIFIQQNI